MLVVIISAAVQGEDQKVRTVSVYDFPKATLNREVGDGKIVEVEMEKEDGVNVYEVEVSYGELLCDIEIRHKHLPKTNAAQQGNEPKK